MTAPTTIPLPALDPNTPPERDSAHHGPVHPDVPAATPPGGFGRADHGDHRDGGGGRGDGGGDGGSPTGPGAAGAPQAPNRFGLSLPQVAGTTLASATSAYAASRLGLAGTLIGAAVGSLIITVAGAVYTHSFRSAHARLRSTSRVSRGVVLVTGLVLAVGLITAVELVVGHPLGNPGESGTTVTRVVTGDTGTRPSTPQHATVPAGAPTPTVTVTATVTPSPTASATATGTATTPAATDTATPTGTATGTATAGTSTASATTAATPTASASTPAP